MALKFPIGVEILSLSSEAHLSPPDTVAMFLCVGTIPLSSLIDMCLSYIILAVFNSLSIIVTIMGYLGSKSAFINGLSSKAPSKSTNYKNKRGSKYKYYYLQYIV